MLVHTSDFDALDNTGFFFAALDIKSVLDIFALTIHDTVNDFVRLALVYF